MTGCGLCPCNIRSEQINLLGSAPKSWKEEEKCFILSEVSLEESSICKTLFYIFQMQVVFFVFFEQISQLRHTDLSCPLAFQQNSDNPEISLPECLSLSWWWKWQTHQHTHQHTGAPIRRCIYNLELSITVRQQGFRAMSCVRACVCVFTESLIKKDQLVLVCECLCVLENQVPLSHCHWLLVLTFGRFGCTDWRWRGFRLQGHPCHLRWNTLNYMGSVWSSWHSLHLKRECILPPMWIIYSVDPEKAKARLTETGNSNVLRTKLLLNDAHSVGAFWLLGPADCSYVKMCPFYICRKIKK